MNASTYNSGGLPGSGFITGTGFVNQLVYALILVLIVHITFFAAEKLYKTFVRYDKSLTDLMPLTYNATDRSYVISQDPTDPNSNPISLSDNERTGVEFSYSFFIFVNPTTFNGTHDLLHVFHKGYGKQYPLLGPGVFMKGNENTMRIYMNSTLNWNTHVDVDNFPVQKWVHVAMVGRAGGLEIYVNGDLNKRVNFSGGTPYQNFQDFYVFSQRILNIPADAGSMAFSGGQSTALTIGGAFQGLLSRLRYFNYAISYTEIAALVNEGPNPKMATGNGQDEPPYLVDTWWTTRYN